MKKILLAFLLVLPFLMFQCKSSKTTAVTKPTSKAGVHFVESDKLSKVLDLAVEENKLVFVDFYATWCVPCKMMDQDVFPNKGIAKFFNDNFISYKVDGEKGNGVNLAALFEVKAYPTLLFLDHKGRVLERKEGAAYHTELRQLAESALANPGR